jgi:hypothetical protein
MMIRGSGRKGLSRRHGEHGGLKTYKLTNLKLAFGEGEAVMFNDEF